MRSLIDADTLQIDTTNACVLQCSGCTHLCGHHKHPFFLKWDEFTRTVDSLAGYPKMIGFIGGEPLLHPDFARQCEYIGARFPRPQLGLWSVFPPGDKYARYREVICSTFGNIFLNDHSRGDIMHAPVLVAIGEHVHNQADLFQIVDHCWVQNAWSPSVTNKGGFFCEVAGELDQLFDGPGGWDISEPGWWKKTPKDFTAQIEMWCTKCGCAMPLARRASIDEKCDISSGNLDLLKDKSRKVAHGQYYEQRPGEFKFDPALMRASTLYPNQTYKDMDYRQGIAARYGIHLNMGPGGNWDPQLMPGEGPWAVREPLFKILEREYNQAQEARA